MTLLLSPQSIDALAEVISGGEGNSAAPPVGIYRSGLKIEKFMRSCNVEFRVVGSRLPDLIDCLINLNNTDSSGTLMKNIIEKAADPRDYFSFPEKVDAVAVYLNRRLLHDGYELQKVGVLYHLTSAGRHSAVVSHLGDKAEIINFDTVMLDLNRALKSADDDPEDAVTAACSIIESVCRSVLIELGMELPDRRDIQGLYRCVRDPLGLSPGRDDLDPQIADDIRKILSGLVTTVEGIGALRTHAGDAHGREKGFRRIDARIARLSLHAASTMALFVIDTWQRKHPEKMLKKG